MRGDPPLIGRAVVREACIIGYRAVGGKQTGMRVVVEATSTGMRVVVEPLPGCA